MKEEEALLELGLKVKVERIRKHLSQDELAELVGLVPRTISKLESGKQNLTFVNLVKVAEALNVPLSSLLDFHKIG